MLSIPSSPVELGPFRVNDPIRAAVESQRPVVLQTDLLHVLSLHNFTPSLPWIVQISVGMLIDARQPRVIESDFEVI
ncbi:hypothetical protein MSG28_008409 [Choristoneura fumiferana]|uniref:Uncharacterized protein n=1 Tax=Choristoneura fumiferana TaxID=7141 RepID=A0ACC0J4Y2_CHOFU|nr:hypothetical protein MSG28_008409 [Choristoneura fumiferana]